jgi:lipopolysaccharide transport system ATP-binding protein
VSTAIEVEGLGKRYALAGVPERYQTLRETIMGMARAPWERRQKPAVPASFWALHGVSFSVSTGEVVGIIGRNGAGKTTLLRILSRITKPTAGRARLRGRVGALLEVGTGFHPELTGRENVYLNGAILGLRKVDIDSRFDAIVSFSELERFLDTPVKHYSTGMQGRLAFSVAAHLEPEILLVDEVLAVGDAAFQRKCLGKMGEVARSGRTVLFVSHNMAAILGLCQRTLLLESGGLVADGPSLSTVERYLDTLDSVARTPLAERRDRRGNQALTFTDFRCAGRDGSTASTVLSGQDVRLTIEYRGRGGGLLRAVHLAVGVHGRFDENLFHLSTTVNGFEFASMPARGAVVCDIPSLPLQPGRYYVTLLARVAGDVADWIQNAGVIEVEAGDFFGSGNLPPPDQGPFLVPHRWSVEGAELEG